MDQDTRTPPLPVALHLVSTAFALPPDLEVVSWHGGSSGAWRLRSPVAGESFSLKTLPADAPSFKIDELRRAGSLERLAVEANLPVVPPVVPAEPEVGVSAGIGDQLVWIHRWVDGVPADVTPAGDGIQPWLGTLIAHLHALQPVAQPDRDAIAHSWGVHAPADWHQWFDEAKDQGQPWAPLRTAVIATAAEVTDLTSRTLAGPALRVCLTHRDVHPPNVLLTPSGPLLCDFGYAGEDVAICELADAALSFPGDPRDAITAYVDAGGEIKGCDERVLAGRLGHALSWLAFSMWVALGHRSRDAAVRATASDRIPGVLLDLQRSVAAIDTDLARLFGGTG